MRSSKFKFAMLTAICAVMAITMIQNVGVSAGAYAIARAIDGPNLASETQVVDSFAADLITYQKDCATLNRKASVLINEVEPLQRKSDALKRRLFDVQNAIRSVVTKLKAANKWNDLDADLLAHATDPRARALLAQGSSKEILESASLTLSSGASDISALVDNLRRKVAAHVPPFTGNRAGFAVARVAYRTPDPAAFSFSLACTVAKVRFALIRRLGGQETSTTLDQHSCACNPGSVGIGTGTPCSAL